MSAIRVSLGASSAARSSSASALFSNPAARYERARVIRNSATFGVSSTARLANSTARRALPEALSVANAARSWARASSGRPLQTLA